MKVKTLTEGYRSYNEDGIIIYKNYYIVLDGATTLFDDQKTNYSSIASELVDYAIKELPDLLDEYSFIEAVHELSKKSYSHFNFKTNDKTKLPSMVIAAAEINDDYTTFYSLGDCGISYQNINNNLYRIYDTSVEKLEKRTIDLVSKTSEKEKILGQLIKNRNLLGIEYQAFIPSLSPSFKVIKRKTITNNIKKILLYTDGYYSLRLPFNIAKNHKEFFDYNIEDAFLTIKERAYSDTDLKQYKRIKIIDDITVIELILNKSNK